ncbi:MAG: nitroreductase family protein [archaeon]|nr:nitroreductase family protein [archaeon]MCP8315345.1 nitroreductase family protein [archaeon]MCP8321481.1 nitroreductase family protein [archaeon]
MIKSHDFLSFIKSRRSIKRLKPDPISRDVIEEILDVAISAPSAHNAQPWCFIIIDDQKVKIKLAEAMAQAWQEDLLKDGLSKIEIERLIEASKERTINASILIITCLTMEDMDKYKDDRRRNAEYFMAVQSVSAAIQNLLLATHAKGLGACWRCAPLFCMKDIREVLKIPDNFDPQALIEVGYPLKQPQMPPRKPLKSVICYNEWV